MIASQVTIDIEQVESFRIVCGECEKRAEIVWHTAKPTGMPFIVALAYVRCHGHARIVEISQFHQRVAELTDQKRITLLWEQLGTIDPIALENNLRGRRAEAARWQSRPDAMNNDAETEHVRMYIAALDKQIELVRHVAISPTQPSASLPTASSSHPQSSR